MSVLQEVSKAAALKYADASGDREAAFDPSIIFVIMDIITELMAAFQNCKKTPSQAVNTMQNPRRIDLLAAKLATRRQIGRREFRRNGDAILEAVFSQGKDTTVEQVEAIYAEIE